MTAAEVSPPRTPREDFGSKVKAHTRYVAADGRQVPGVTTVLGVLNRPALVGWANRLGLQGIDSSKYTDEAASVGSLAHLMVESHLKGEEPDLSDFTPNQVDRATWGFEQFRRWESHHTLEPILVEEALVSERFRYGGTVDCFALLDGLPTLLDFKTSSAIYPEHRTQAAAYVWLLLEAGHEVSGARILKIGRSEAEGFEEHVLDGVEVQRRMTMFRHCLAIYGLQKELKR